MKTLFTLLCAFAIVLPASAQQSDTLKSLFLNEVVISAEKRVSPASSVSNSVSVITAEEIARTGKTSLYDILLGEQGVFMYRQGQEGGLTYGSIRGGNSNHLLVLLNGVRMNMANDPGNSFDFANINISTIERIEIVRGPQSVLYGSQALSGVVNIITKKNEAGISLNAEAGSYGTFKGDVTAAGSVNNLRYSFNYNNARTSGFSAAGEKYGNTEKDGWKRQGADASIQWQSGETELSLSYRFMKSAADLDQFGGKGGDDPTYKGDIEETAYKLHFISPEFSGIKSNLALSYFRNFRKYKYDALTPFGDASTSNYDGNEFRFDWQNDVTLNKYASITFGIDYTKQSAVSEYLSTWYNSIFTEKSIGTTGIYAQAKHKIGDLFFTAGVRHESHQQAGNALTYSLGANYFIPATGTKLKATLGTGFKAPSLFYLYDPQYGNALLKPEQNKAIDAGFEQYVFAGNFVFSGTWFKNDYTDLFGFDKSFRAINIAASGTTGFEAAAQVFLPFSLSIKANYTYTDAVDKSAGSPDFDKQLLRRPKNKGSVTLTYTGIKAFNVNADVIITGEREDKDFSLFPAQRITLSSYTLVNLAVVYSAYPGMELYARGFNLLNKEYEEVFGFANPKTSVFFGVRYSL